MVAMSLAALLLQPAPDPVRIDCTPTSNRSYSAAGDGAATWPLVITITQQGGAFASVLMEGPGSFSSYRPGSRLLRPRPAQWRGRLRRGTILLGREGWEMELAPEARTEGAYSGFWNAVAMVEHRRMAASGGLRCRIVAGTLSESARP